DGTALEEGVSSRRSLAGRIGDYIENTVGKACDVMGCSFGGAVAMWLAIDRPQLVDHLVLECPAGLQTIDPALRADPAAFRRALFAYPEKAKLAPKPPEVEAQNRRMLAHYGAEDGKDEGLLEEVARISQPTLILHGTLDRIVGMESMQL